MSYSMMKYSAAIIGTGRIGYYLQKDRKREQPASHSAALKNNKRINLIAACDKDEKKLYHWQKDYPFTHIYKDNQELMKKENPDIVVISVEEKAHLPVIEDVIPYKPKLIILEKPVAPNLSDAIRIKELAKEHQVPIQINHERRFSKDYLLLKELLKSGEMGQIQSIQATFSSGLKVWHENALEDGKASLLHDGTHLIDILHYLFHCRLSNPIIDQILLNDGELKSLYCHYLGENGVIYLEINGAKNFFGFDLQINTANAKIIIGNGYLDVFTRKKSPFYQGFYSLIRDKYYVRPRKTAYFSAMIDNCISYLDGESPLISPLREGINAMETLFEIVTQLNTEKKIS